MRRHYTTLAALGLAVTCGAWSDAAGAQQARAGGAAQLDFWPVRGNVYMLAGAGGNVTASVGSDGVLLVDTGTAEASDAVAAALSRLQERLALAGRLDGVLDADAAIAAPSRLPNYVHAPVKPVRYVINTSARLDHSGANAALAAPRNGGAAAPVIAQENVLIRLVSGEAPFERLPTETFSSGEHVLGNAFNGDRIRLIHVPAAVTDGDTMVYFRAADIISTGDVFSMETFPVIDVDSGGSIDGVIRALNAILRLAIPEAYGEGGTLIVPGHGRLADSADVGYYRDMLTIIREQVRNAIDSGMTLDQIRVLRPTLGFEGRFGAESSGWTADMFLEAVYRSLREPLQ
jgi:glyoxylase-like metal-dependent hydrolase (beta-lactamase superfamily II)